MYLWDGSAQTILRPATLRYKLQDQTFYPTQSQKSCRKRDSNPGSSALEADALTTRPTRRLYMERRSIRLPLRPQKPHLQTVQQQVTNKAQLCTAAFGGETRQQTTPWRSSSMAVCKRWSKRQYASLCAESPSGQAKHRGRATNKQASKSKTKTKTNTPTPPHGERERGGGGGGRGVRVVPS